MKDLILKYLQEKPLELRSKFPEILDVSFADDPPRLVVIAEGKIKLPKIMQDGQLLKVELASSKDADILEKEVAGENENVAAWKTRHGGIAATKPKTEAVSESINPASKGAKSAEAYEAWKKRHNGVKVDK